MYTVAVEKELHLSRSEINKTLIATEQPYFAENLNPNKGVDRRARRFSNLVSNNCHVSLFAQRILMWKGY